MTSSAIETAFDAELSMALAPWADYTREAEVPTAWGVFRLDFLVRIVDGRRVAFECDGAEYHHDVERDEWRDALILGERGADVIYRLPGTAIHCHRKVLFYLLSRREPWLFTKRTRVNLGIQCSDARQAVLRHAQPNGPSAGPWEVEWTQTTEGPDGWGHADWESGETRQWSIRIERHVLTQRMASLHRFATRVGAAALDDVRDRYNVHLQKALRRATKEDRQ